MRMEMCAAILAMLMVGTGAVAQDEAAQIEDPEPNVSDSDGYPERPLKDMVKAVVAAAREGYLDGISAAGWAMGNELGESPGSVCLRGMPAEPGLTIELPNLSGYVDAVTKLPAGPASSGHETDQNMMWYRYLESEFDMGSCSAGGMAYIAVTQEAVESSTAESWVEWANQ